MVINTFRLLQASFHSNIYRSSAQNDYNAEDFCSIIIETRYGKLPKAHRSPTDLLWWSRNWQSFLQRFTLPFCVVKRCHYFDILQKNTYKTSINSTFATKTVKNLHICNFCSTFAAQRSRLNEHGVSRLYEAAKPK